MKNLKKLRQQNNISQEKLAEVIYTSQQAIYKYEAGLSQPDINRLIDIADYFHTSVDYLIGHTDDPRPYHDFITTDLTSEELLLIENFRLLPCEIQAHFLALITHYSALSCKMPSESLES